MTPEPTTVMILGAGRLAEAHARVVVAHPDLRLVAIVEPDEVAGTALIERIVKRFEGERALLFGDLDSALRELDMDIVAIGDGNQEMARRAAAAGKVVIGGPGTGGSGRWFPFGDAPSAGNPHSADSAFGDHLRQYEDVLSGMGRGPVARGTGAGE